MTKSPLWSRDVHTAAKHTVLRRYLDAWIPVMAYQTQKSAPDKRLLLVDGFAGPGRYLAGEEGSPLIMLRALVDHSNFSDWHDVRFIFWFIEKDQAAVTHLESEIEALDLPSNVEVAIEHGDFEETFGAEIEGIAERGSTLIPTFAFIDPFGYTQAPISLAQNFLGFPRCEMLFFLPLSNVARFIGRAGQENAMNSLFGCEEWRQALDLDGVERREFLIDLFEKGVQATSGVKYVRSIELRTKDGNDYRLVFALGHPKGLELAKGAMWSIDPVSGTRFSTKTHLANQEVLFQLEPDTAPLLAELRERFGTDWFAVEEAESFILNDTPFLKTHLKNRTLRPAEKAGTIEVWRTRQGFAGASVRFKQ